MIGSLLFLSLGTLAGFALLRLFRTLRLIEQLVWAAPLGIMLLTTVTFALALPLPSQQLAILTATLLAAIGVLVWFFWSKQRQALCQDWQTAWRRTTRRDILAAAIVMIPTLIYTIITVPLLLFFRNGDLIAGWINVWGDWAVHLRASTFFAGHPDLTLESPLYAGTTFHYPYLAAYLSAILQQLNLNLAASLTWPTVLLFGLLPAQLYLLAHRITGSRSASIVATYLFLLAGGGGVIHLLGDLLSGTVSWSVNPYQPILYTDWGRVNGLSTNQSIWFMNFIMSEFLPQRAFLAGIGPALFVLLVFWSQFMTTAKTVEARLLLFAGILVGILPLIHTHSLVALAFITPALWLTSRQHPRALPWFIIPAVSLGLFTLFRFVFDTSATGSFIQPMTWWVPRPDDPVNPITYWLWNAGPLIILGLVSAFSLPRYRPLLGAGAILWLVGNFIAWQPWNYDNLKLLTYWYLLWTIPVALWLTRLPRWALPATLVLSFLLTGAGLADSLTVTGSALAGGLSLSSQRELAYAQAVTEATPSDALILSATHHDHPLSLASGRQLYMGYEGWLWTYGIDWSARHDEIKAMYQADAAGLALIEARGIDYIAVTSREINELKASPELARHFPTVVDMNGYKLLKVR